MQWHHVPSDITMVVLALIIVLVMVVLAGHDAMNGSTGININISTSTNTNTKLRFSQQVTELHEEAEKLLLLLLGSSPRSVAKPIRVLWTSFLPHCPNNKRERSQHLPLSSHIPRHAVVEGAVQGAELLIHSVVDPTEHLPTRPAHNNWSERVLLRCSIAALIASPLLVFDALRV